MFRCEGCRQVVGPRISCRWQIVQRSKFYPRRPEVYRKIIIERGKKKVKWLDDPGGDGWEIAREIALCPECAKKRGVMKTA